MPNQSQNPQAVATPQGSDWQNAEGGAQSLSTGQIEPGGQVEPVPLPKLADSVNTGGIAPAAEVKGDLNRGGIPKAAIGGVAALLILIFVLMAGLFLAGRLRTGEIRKLSRTNAVPTRAVIPTAILTPTPQPTTTPTTISANCVSLVGQMVDGLGNWVTKTDSEFAAAARPGDEVRFMCTGAKSYGNFTKPAFLINKVLYVDEVIKLDETQFGLDYVIGAAGVLTVESVLLLDDSQQQEDL